MIRRCGASWWQTVGWEWRDVVWIVVSSAVSGGGGRAGAACASTGEHGERRVVRVEGLLTGRRNVKALSLDASPKNKRGTGRDKRWR